MVSQITAYNRWTLTGSTNKHPDILSFSCGKWLLICSSRICTDCCVDLPMEEKAITRTPLFELYLIKCAPLPCPLLSIVNHQNNLSVRMYVWNDTQLVNKEILKLEAVETIWRDFYTGQRLSNWTKPKATPEKDSWFGGRTSVNGSWLRPCLIWPLCLEPRSTPISWENTDGQY